MLSLILKFAFFPKLIPSRVLGESFLSGKERTKKLYSGTKKSWKLEQTPVPLCGFLEFSPIIPDLVVRHPLCALIQTSLSPTTFFPAARATNAEKAIRVRDAFFFACAAVRYIWAFSLGCATRPKRTSLQAGELKAL